MAGWLLKDVADASQSDVDGTGGEGPRLSGPLGGGYTQWEGVDPKLLRVGPIGWPRGGDHVRIRSIWARARRRQGSLIEDDAAPLVRDGRARFERLDPKRDAYRHCDTNDDLREH